MTSRMRSAPCCCPGWRSTWMPCAFSGRANFFGGEAASGGVTPPAAVLFHGGSALNKGLRSFDEDFRTRDVGGSIGSQEPHQLGHLSGGAGISAGQRYLALREFHGMLHLLQIPVLGGIFDVGFDGSGTDHVDAHFV